MILSGGVAPFDAVLRVEYHHAVRHGSAGAAEIVERRRQLRLALPLPAQHAVEIREHPVPYPPALGHLFRDGIPQPLPQQPYVAVMRDGHDEEPRGEYRYRHSGPG